LGRAGAWAWAGAGVGAGAGAGAGAAAGARVTCRAGSEAGMAFVVPCGLGTLLIRVRVRARP